MPMSDGSLTHEEQQKFQKLLDDTWISKRCPVCENGQWIGPRHAIYMPLARQPGGGNAGNIVPLLALTCTKCSHVLLFNAVRIGIYEPIAEPTEAPTQSDKPTSEVPDVD